MQRSICARCLVRDECADAGAGEFGIWGGEQAGRGLATGRPRTSRQAQRDAARALRTVYPTMTRQQTAVELGVSTDKVVQWLKRRTIVRRQPTFVLIILGRVRAPLVLRRAYARVVAGEWLNVQIGGGDRFTIQIVGSIDQDDWSATIDTLPWPWPDGVFDVIVLDGRSKGARAQASLDGHQLRGVRAFRW